MQQRSDQLPIPARPAAARRAPSETAAALQAVPVARTRAFSGLRKVAWLGLATTALAAGAMGWLIGTTTIAGAVITTGVD